MSDMTKAVFCSNGEDDLISALRQSGYEPCLARNAGEALETVSEGGAVFLLADEYPSRGTELTADMLACARAKNVKLYIEYPEYILGRETGEAKTIVYERVVAPDGFFGSMENGAILMINGCWYRECHAGGPGLLCLAKVAGFDHMAFGLPEKYVTILDWMDEKEDVLVASSCLSSFITGRYAPAVRWKALWETLLKVMGVGEINLRWKGSVSVEADEAAPLKEDAARSAWKRNVQWAHEYMLCNVGHHTSVFEGYRSNIDHKGRQHLLNCARGDCMGEVAMELGYGCSVDEEVEKYG